MFCHSEMQNAPATVSDDEEAVEHAKGEGGHGEKIHRSNGFAVIVKKYLPALCRFWIFGVSFAKTRSWGTH